MKKSARYFYLMFFVLILARASSCFADVDLSSLSSSIEHAVTNKTLEITHPEAINQLYTNNHFQALWFDDGALSGQRTTLLAEIEASFSHGFEPFRYHYEELLEASLPKEILDVLLSDALLTQIEHRSNGVIQQELLDDKRGNWFIEQPSIVPFSLVQSILANPEMLGKTLKNLWPETPEYWALIEKRAELSTLIEAVHSPLTLSKPLKPGVISPEVQALKSRLWGSEDFSPLFDQPLESAIKKLQVEANLEPDGIVGPATLALINATHQSRIAQIDANLERWRWLPREVPEKHIRVNIASFRLKVFEKQTAVLAMDVIVGRPYRQTPVFTETLKYLVFNPYWNVPPSIARKDKLPLLKANTDLLAQLGYEVKLVNSTDFISVDQIDWKDMKAGKFTLRQKPGENNALGKIKFMLPNSHDIYLHDTPDKKLFAKSERLFSSGCIRLSDPQALAFWLLIQENNPFAKHLDALFLSTETTTVQLLKPIPVYLVYLTAFVNNNDQVVFRRDIYERDQAIINILHPNGSQVDKIAPSE